VVDDSCVAQWIEDYADAWRSGDAEAVPLRFGSDGRCQERREYWHVETGRTAAPGGCGTQWT
jgi:hypothetical protein